MASRLELHKELCKILGTNNVYYQPPESVKMTYPCIVYERRSPYKPNADDRLYIHYKAYDVTLIDRNPDSEYIDAILNHFNLCSHNRHFTNDNLNHDAFTLYY